LNRSYKHHVKLGGCEFNNIRAIRNNEVTYVKADVTNVRNSANGESGGQSQSPNANDGAVSFRVVEQSGEEGIFIGNVWNP